MTKKELHEEMPEVSIANQDLVGVPTYFADQPVSLQAGPFVSKITMGTTGINDEMIATYTIAMPTPHMAQMAKDLHAMFESAEYRKASQVALQNEGRKLAGPRKNPSDANE